MKERVDKTAVTVSSSKLPYGNMEYKKVSNDCVFNRKMLVASVGRTRTKLKVDCCNYKLFSMKNLTENNIALLRKNVGSIVTASIQYDPWKGSYIRCGWVLVGVKQ